MKMLFLLRPNTAVIEHLDLLTCLKNVISQFSVQQEKC